MRFLLDTNVVSELILPRPDATVVAWFDSVDEEALFLSVVTIAELRFGTSLLREGRKKQALEEWLTSSVLPRFEGRILDVTPSVAEEWGRFTAKGATIGIRRLGADALIAATAAVHQCVVVTRDRDLSAFGIEVLNPWKHSS